MAYIDTERDSFPTFHQKELNDYMKGWNACLKSVLQQTPTADVVEVVRCRDCKHCQKVQDERDNDWYFCLNSANNKSVEATDFCSYGERRTHNDKQ